MRFDVHRNQQGYVISQQTPEGVAKQRYPTENCMDGDASNVRWPFAAYNLPGDESRAHEETYFGFPRWTS